MGGDKPTILVVEDEQALLDIYEQWLSANYEVRTATDGEAALDRLDNDVAVVLLDRLMPGMSGDEVLTAIRERTDECRVAMVTAVEPDFDILEMGFDDYLTKPVEHEELEETVDRLLARSSFADLERELYALASKRAALQSSKTSDELADDDRYRDLEARIETLREQLDETLPDVSTGEFVAMVRELDDVPDNRADSITDQAGPDSNGTEDPDRGDGT